jgi:uncharacterized protein (TIGR04255 family)
MVERFGVTGAPKTSVRFEMVQKPPVPRCWFLNKDGTQLVQVQQDRIAHNWRKGESGGVYPRYESIRETFKNELRVFGDFLIREGIGAWVPDLCEITYINQILPNSEWHDHGQLSKILTLFTDRETEEFLPPPEDAQLNCRYVIPGDEGDPIGRLHISVRPAFRRVDDRPIYLLDLVARGVPAGEGIEGVLRFLDLGRTWVVKAFVSITTPEMQTIWGRVR